MLLLPRIFWEHYQKPQAVKDLTEGENDLLGFVHIQWDRESWSRHTGIWSRFEPGTSLKAVLTGLCCVMFSSVRCTCALKTQRVAVFQMKLSQRYRLVAQYVARLLHRASVVRQAWADTWIKSRVKREFTDCGAGETGLCVSYLFGQKKY